MLIIPADTPDNDMRYIRTDKSPMISEEIILIRVMVFFPLNQESI